MKKTLLGFFTSLFNAQTAENKYKEGNDKAKLEEHRRAIADHTKAIELNPNDSMAYITRGKSNIKINKKDSAYLDFSKAGELGNREAYDLIEEYCK